MSEEVEAHRASHQHVLRLRPAVVACPEPAEGLRTNGGQVSVIRVRLIQFACSAGSDQISSDFTGTQARCMVVHVAVQHQLVGTSPLDGHADAAGDPIFNEPVTEHELTED
ncbi:MAG TPA: hypothetical protein VFG67_01075 [Oleiagrimonas sp.]|nr:hypothetical protein [Oleiagrimonas sp.]